MFDNSQGLHCKKVHGKPNLHPLSFATQFDSETKNKEDSKATRKRPGREKQGSRIGRKRGWGEESEIPGQNIYRWG